MIEEIDLAQAEYGSPSRCCDVVMKGGITSGVVYPLAVCELARTYRFRNVGGTSAGAIAAAATAAAEYGRKNGGFNRLASLPAWIGADKNLQGLFQPQPKTRRLFRVLIANLEGGGGRAASVALLSHLPAFLLGAALGIAVLVVALLEGLADGFDAALILAMVGGALLIVIGGAIGVVLHMLRQLLRGVPDNRFGLCSGGPGEKSKGAVALTPWLTDLINETAGLPKDEPLTFGHLWTGPGRDRRDQPKDPDDRYLQLEMMTTNLVNRRAHRLPWDSREWFFDPDEFRELFPPEVVDWMVAHPPDPPAGYSPAKVQASRMRRALALPLRPLPAPADIPVVVAARMSLSFPVLLSAVPLWGIDMARPENAVLDEWRSWAKRIGPDWDPLDDPEHWPEVGQPETRPEVERCWFSDGGISSNFPIHFFDRLVPRWPTFAINLRPFPNWERPSRTDQAKNTWMVDSNEKGILEWWHRFPDRRGVLGFNDTRLFAFFNSAIRTMQNRNDEAQMRAPGYRDRVAHVNMTDGEGGMNLTMPPKTIAALTARGRAAAARLREAYTPPDPPEQAITWDNHRWVRLRSALGVLEEMHEQFAAGYGGEPEHRRDGERSYEQLVERGRGEPPKSYEWGGAEKKLGKDEIAGIAAAAELLVDGRSVREGAPNPRPEGRIVPRE
ncbi:MAG TPA: phage holin family protein [Solirubrobacterales bacterium]|nr:phage holin family protein [Solirubrobacterales bacterium]